MTNVNNIWGTEIDFTAAFNESFIRDFEVKDSAETHISLIGSTVTMNFKRLNSDDDADSLLTLTAGQPGLSITGSGNQIVSCNKVLAFNQRTIYWNIKVVHVSGAVFYPYYGHINFSLF